MSVKAMSLVGLDVHARQTHAAALIPRYRRAGCQQAADGAGGGGVVSWRVGAWVRAVYYLASVELLMGRRTGLISAQEAQIPCCSHAPVIARLRCVRGVDTLIAAGLCVEVGDFTRGEHRRRANGVSRSTPPHP
jgi:hypothetical protein